MSLSITIDLSDADLLHFQEVVKRAQEGAGTKTAKEITDAAGQLLREAEDKQVPEFISQRLCKLEALINMVVDDGWGLSDEDKKRVLTALMYFADPKDVIPDNVPVVGLLDDAIMIELCVRELKHEVDAYEDFCSYRKKQAADRGVEANSLLRADWLDERRVELQERMRRRRTGSYAGAGGMSVFGVR